MSTQDQTPSKATVTSDIDTRNATQDILGTAEADGQFTTILAAIYGAGLEGAFQDPEFITVFLPSDDAIASTNTDVITRLMHRESRNQLDGLLRYHILRGAVSAADLHTADHVRMSNGQILPVTQIDSGLRIGGALVTESDISCTNGIIHIIDTILLPSH